MEPPKRIKIVLADDDALDREMFIEALNELPVAYDLKEVINGKELTTYLNKCQNNYPDCIFLDLNMPLVDGREALREIKNSEKLKCIPVFMLSTSSSVLDINFCYKHGANLFFVKPSDYGQLVKTLQNIMELFGTTIVTPYIG